MDATTNLALRAIVRGLRQSGAIDDQGVAAIAASLHDAEELQRGQRHGCVAYDLMQLAAEIGRDCAAPPPPAQEPEIAAAPNP